MQPPANSTAHTYFSFISYKHEDEKTAKWLKKALESYRLPSKLCRQYQSLPNRLTQIGDIYLDNDTLRPGLMEKNLHSDMSATKYTYFADYTEVWGIPQGIGELTRKETASMRSHYTIITQKNKVRQLRHENSAGQLMEHDHTERTDLPVQAVYSYKDSGELEAVTYQNTRSELS